MSQICKFEGCKKYAVYGEKGTKIRIFCKNHKPVDYVNVARKQCLVDGCNSYPIYGEKETGVILFCRNHKPDNYIDLFNKRCLVDGCNSYPVYGKKGTKVRLVCGKHKLDDYVNLRSRKCLVDGCKTSPCYGKENSRIPEYCVLHKVKDYVNIVRRKCLFPGCKSCPSYGKENSKIPEYCALHKVKDYIDIVHKRCSFSGCNSYPSYGKINSKRAEYCGLHTPEDYVNIVSRRCSFDGCKTVPNYGKKGSNIGEYCIKHKMKDHVDVKNKVCIFPECTTRARFGFLFQQKTSCALHKTPNMYNKNNPKCDSDCCKNIPCYTDKKDSYPLRCDDHKLLIDIIISESNCIICDQTLFIKSDSKMCNICSKVDVSKNLHEKELKIKTLLEDEGIHFIYDKISDVGCHKYRPDFLIDCNTHYIVIEVDENQHSSYTEQCETTRMINIQQGFGGMKVLFIRFNPDGYTNSLNKKVRAGITLSRTKRLLSLIKSSMLHPPPHLLSVVKLYYDGDDETNIISEINVDKLFNTYQTESELIFLSEDDE